MSTILNPLRTASVGITIDGAGSAITTGVKQYISMPWDGTIVGWVLVADVSGSIVIDVWKTTYANHPPTISNTIAGSELPTISSATKNQNLALSTWSISIQKGDVVGFNVNSCSTITKATLTILVQK